MANSVYVMSTEPRCGSSTVLLGLAELLSGAGRRIAFFRPIVGDPGDSGRDPHIQLLLSRFQLPFSYEDCFACSLREARELVNSRRQIELF